MAAAMTPYERALATLQDEPVDELSAYPLACGLQRRLLPGHVTYRDWAMDANACAQSFVEGFNTWKFPFTVTLQDLSCTAHDFGAHVRMDTENTPFIDKHIISTPEEYETLELPDCTKGRTGVLIDLNRKVAKDLKDKSFTIAFLEGPLLTLSQSRGAEELFMDMFTDPTPVHKALEVTTEFCRQAAEKLGETGIQGLCWDYLWGNYSALGDAEYHEFEGDMYAKITNEQTRKSGMGLGVHNCADLPHLDTQVKQFGVDIFSMAYYPQVSGSPSLAKTIDDGYAEKCVMMGDIDPQLFMRASEQQITDVTSKLCQETKTALCKAGLHSHAIIASGCEVPPDLECKMENVTAVMNAVHKYGAF